MPTGSDGRPVGVPIAAGERLAIWLELASSPQIVAAAPGGGTRFHNSDHTSGSQPYTGALAHIDIQGVVEPDADGDMYGDETQDFCATDPTRQGHCAPPEPEPEPTPPDAPPDDCPANDQRLDDCTAPSVQITSGPKAKTAKTKARFEFAADESASFECALDKGGFLPCTSAKRFRRLKPGRHAFYLRATDINGNVSAPSRSAGV